MTTALLRSILPALLVFALSLLGPAPARAAGPVTLASEVKLETVVVEDGARRVVLVDPGVVVPGDRLLFRTRYRNTASDAVEGFVVTNPLPAGIALAADADPALTLSVDGGRTWGHLAALRVPAADGTRRAAQASDVTHLRWTLPPIAAGEGGEVEFHGIVK